MGKPLAFFLIYDKITEKICLINGGNMFAYIKGSIEEKSSGYVVIEANGVGYKIFIALRNIILISNLLLLIL